MAGDRPRAARRGLYLLPTAFTVGSMFCGYLSIWKSIHASFEWAAALILIAGVLDGLDGRVARMTGTASEFGKQYDSLADLVSFGVAPAILLYFWCLSGETDLQRLGFMTSFLFVVCGSMRLARFNLQAHIVDKRYFVGLPIPMAASVPATCALAAPHILLDRTGFFAAEAVTILLSYLMVSTIRYRSFKDLDLRRRRPIWVLPLIALSLALLGYRPQFTLLAISAIFAISGPATKVVSSLRWLSKKAP